METVSLPFAIFSTYIPAAVPSFNLIEISTIPFLPETALSVNTNLPGNMHNLYRRFIACVAGISFQDKIR
jgi:hypothetical protein